MSGLPRRPPSSVGVDPVGVQRFLEAAATENIELHSLLLVRHGAVATEGWWAPYDAHTPHLVYSLSKSFVATAVGLAVDEGLLRLDEPVVELFADLAPVGVACQIRRITLEHCLRMATGHADDAVWPVVDRCGQSGANDWLAAFLSMTPEHEPGTVFAYNQLATYAAARAVERATGHTVLDYLGPRLFEPLGAGPVGWLTDALGHDWGFSGLHLTTEAVAAFGQLLLQDGEWEGRRLLPSGWVELAVQAHTANDVSNRGSRGLEPDPDWSVGYGYQFWRSRNGYRGDGAYGQFCLVLPEHDAVLALTSSTERMQAVLDLVWEHLLPALGEAQGPDAHAETVDDRALGEHLRGLAIPPPSDDRGGSPGRFIRAGGGGWPPVAAITLAQGTHGYQLILDGDTAVPVGSGRWLPGNLPGDPALPLASAGGWRGGRFHADLRLVQTPHVLQIELDPAGSTFRIAWREEPLHGPDPAAMAVRLRAFGQAAGRRGGG